MTYRVGNHQPQNVYRGDQYIGVMFTPEDAALAVEALNALPRCRVATCPDFGDPDFGEGTCPAWHAVGQP
jgi:hypothetical protein